jgi:hypothetical protein
VIAVSPVFGELLQGAKNQNERQLKLDFWKNLPKLDEREIFLRAGLESGIHKWTDRGVGLIDNALLQHSREQSVIIWTLDKKLFHLLNPEQKYHP